jgi:hypothetical protein
MLYIRRLKNQGVNFWAFKALCKCTNKFISNPSVSLWSSKCIPSVWDMSDTRLRHRVKNIIALFSYATYTVHGGYVWVVLAGHCSSTSPLPTQRHRCGSMTGRHNPHVCNCNWGGERGDGGWRGVEWKNKLPSVFKVSQISQKCSICYVWAHSVILTEIPLHWYKKYQNILRNVHTGAIYVQALSLIHSHPCTSFHCGVSRKDPY